MRTLGRTILVFTLTASAFAASRDDLKRDGKELAGPRAIAGSAVSAGIGQARNRPGEWGGGAAGFGKRFASSLGQHAIKGVIELGVGAWRHEDLRYHPSGLQGTWPRMKYAVKSTFIVPRTNGAGKTVAVGRISGNFGAGLISRAWQPASTAGVGAGLVSGGIGLGADVGYHVAREFWPHRKHAAASSGQPAPSLASGAAASER
jgi:hypothetical protein